MRGRIPKPWKRASDGQWWVTLDGRQIKLGASKHAAHVELAKLQAQRGRGPIPGKISVAVLFDLWASHTASQVKPDTMRNYRHYMRTFVEFTGSLDARDLKPWHVTQW